jgi:hypothetical protein
MRYCRVETVKAAARTEQAKLHRGLHDHSASGGTYSVRQGYVRGLN